MSKIGILTFHYSNNYGGVLQALSLYRVIESLGYNVEILNYIPSSYKPYSYFSNLGINRNILKKKYEINLPNILKKIVIMNKYCRNITTNFNEYRSRNMILSKQVDEDTLESILNNYSVIIVGSDQIWNPSQRKSPIYFLNFRDKYKGNKISYAADSTIREVNNEDLETLQTALNEFDNISVRNEHSHEFIKTTINIDAEIVADPTLLVEFDHLEKLQNYKEEYILMYVLGKEIQGSHKKAIEKIKQKYGNLPVYSIKIPTMNFELSPFADKVFYDLDPDAWIDLFSNAKFIYTDSFHGVLFSLKYHKPFLAYYTERLRATRFIDLGKRYGIDNYIVQNVSEIDDKKSLNERPDYPSINRIINLQKKSSVEFLRKSLSELKYKNKLR